MCEKRNEKREKRNEKREKRKEKREMHKRIMKETCKRDINHVSLVSLVVGWRRLIGCLGARQAEGLQTQSQPHATGSTHRNCEVCEV